MSLRLLPTDPDETLLNLGSQAPSSGSSFWPRAKAASELAPVPDLLLPS